MKILHIGKFYSPIEGGIESINRFIVDTLSDDYEQRVLSFNSAKSSVEDEVKRVPVVRAGIHGVVASQPISIRYYVEMHRYVRMFKPNVIHFHYPNPLGALYLLLCIRRENKLIVHWHSDVVAQKLLQPFVAPIERKLLKRADAVIATSPNYLEASDALQRVKEKVSVIPCSIDEQRWHLKPGDEARIAEIKARYGGKPIVFFIGRHVEYKGIKFLLEAEKLMKQDCALVIAGQGPLTAELKTNYQSPRIHWVGRLSDDEMRCYYHAASIFAFPSITRNEAFGVVLAESMYCGCPSVTFTIKGSGVNWVSVNGETGIEVENSDYKAYATAVDRLLSDDVLREKLSGNAIKRVKELFSKEVVEKAYREIYNRLLAKV